MAAILMWAHAGLRRRLGAAALLAAMIALGAGVTMAGAAAARRGDSAVPRFLASLGLRGHEVSVEDPAYWDQEPAIQDAVRSLPQVAGSVRGAFMLAAPEVGDGQFGQVGAVYPIATADVRGEPGDRPYLVDGVLADPSRAAPDEVMIDESTADHYGLRPGSHWAIKALAPEQFTFDVGGEQAPEGPTIPLRVVGIVRYPSDLQPQLVGDQDAVQYRDDWLYLGDAFWDRYGDRIANFGLSLSVQLHDESEARAFARDLERLTGGAAQLELGSDDQIEAARATQKAIDVETNALLLFAAVAALATLLIVGQTVVRQALVDAADDPLARAMGMTGPQLTTAAALRAVPVAVVGAIAAVTLAVAVSPLAPIGLARRAEVDPGLDVDGAVLAIGALVVLVGVPAMAAAAAMWSGRRAAAPAAPSRLATWLAGAGATPASVAGIRMAFERGSGSRAVPVRTALAATAVGVAACTAAAVFSVSLDTILRDPEAQGWQWDVVVGNGEEDLAERGPDLLAREPAVASFASGILVRLSLEGQQVPGVALHQYHGSITPTVVEGRPPHGPDEVALGTETLSSLDLSLGDTVRGTSLAGGDDAGEDAEPTGPARELEVVGRIIFPGGLSIDEDATLGRGAVLDADAAEALGADMAPAGFLVRLAPGFTAAEAEPRLERGFGNTMVTQVWPIEVENIRRVRALPLVLALLVGLLGLATLTHALLTSIRRRRHELVILRVLGFDRRQVRWTVAWQATAMTVAALAIGLPLGVVFGRWAWRLAADSIDAITAPSTPVIALLIAVPVGVLVTNLVAALPGRAASRRSAAVVLRTE